MSAVVMTALTGQDIVTAGHVSHCHACKNHIFARGRIKSFECMKPLCIIFFINLRLTIWRRPTSMSANYLSSSYLIKCNCHFVHIIYENVFYPAGKGSDTFFSLMGPPSPIVP